MTTEFLALIALYFTCSETAETRVLDRGEVEACTSLYMEGELGLVPDVSVGEYENMSVSMPAKPVSPIAHMAPPYAGESRAFVPKRVHLHHGLLLLYQSLCCSFT